MHVLYHHRTAGDRVEAVHIMGIVRPLRAMGHMVEICSPPGCDPERKAADAPKGAARAEVRLRGRLKRFARSAPDVLFELAELAYNAYSLLDIVRRSRRRRPDLIYERTTSNSIAPTLMAGVWNIPIVQEVNVTAEIGRLRPLVLGGLTRRIERWIVRRATLLVTVSEHFRRMLVDAGFPEDKILVCQNAVHPEDFEPARVEAVARPASLGRDALVVGYVGAFVPYHRLDMLTHAAAALRQDHPNARWLLVGEGVDRPSVESAIAEHGLQDWFWLPGAVAHAMVPAYVKAMDVAVLPNSERFNSPMKLFEYMAMGRPVVAPRVPAIEEVIADGENGLLFAPGDVRGFEEAVACLLGDAELRARLGENARRCVLEKHTWRRNAEKVLAALKALRATSKRGAAG